MAEDLRVVLLVVLLAAGLAMTGYAGYLQYASLPDEHDARHISGRAALALGGMGLLLGASRLF